MGPERTTDDYRLAALDLTRQALRGLRSGTIDVSTLTQSMAPLLHGGEILHWRRIDGAPATGALVIFIERAGLIVHRVIGRRRGGGLRTKGDNRAGPDPRPVESDDVVGVVEAIESGGGRTELTSRGARAYARLAALISTAGWLTYVPAWIGDRALARVPGWGDREFFRAPAFALQRYAQRALHRALFRALHTARPAGAGPPPTTTTAPEDS